MSDTPTPATMTEIADLLAWTRRLGDHPRTADPAERAAYQQAKTDLLARLSDTPLIAAEDGDR